MPFVRIDLREGKPAEYRRAVADLIYEAMTGVSKVSARS
jgi:phenylpyruvate tautomerase PptA (4-oxalocrotonate tautomerase family)